MTFSASYNHPVEDSFMSDEKSKELAEKIVLALVQSGQLKVLGDIKVSSVPLAPATAEVVGRATDRITALIDCVASRLASK